MRIYLDLDNTLIATYTFYQDYYRPLLIAGGSTEREIEKSYTFFTNGVTRASGELFTPRRQMEILGWRDSVREEALNKVENILREKRGFIFPEVVSALTELKQRGAYLVVLTFGHPELQKQKLIASGMGHFFDEVIITNENKANLLRAAAAEVKEKIFFVDDRSQYMTELQNDDAIVTVHMSRPEIGAECLDKKCGAKHEIQNLNELLAFIH